MASLADRPSIPSDVNAQQARQALRQAIKACKGDQTCIANAVGVYRSTLAGNQS